uniref:CBM20 domain-containing protein n=1 Tax=Mola mola TaxID=94237 RepID=A0A3Q3XQZ6_MOLML
MQFYQQSDTFYSCVYLLKDVEDVTADKEVSNKKASEETPPFCRNGDDDGRQNNKIPLEVNREEHIIPKVDVPAPYVGSGEDEKLDSVDYSSNGSSPEEEKERGDKRADDSAVDASAELSSEDGTAMLHVRESDWDADETGEVVEEVSVKDHLNNLSTNSPQFDELKEGKEGENEEDYERTEISIMEATMDHNEWVTDNNYQVFPWLNRLPRDQTKTSQLPVEERSAVTVTTSTDLPPSTLSDENTENNKRVVAVQPMPQKVNVTFRIHYFTQSPYQMVAITGNQPELGNWMGFIPLERAMDGYWTAVVSLPAESRVEWKFAVLDKGEVCRWEECGNRLLDTGYGDDLLVHKWWGLI